MPTPYNIGILGTTGEGKTIYLSTLYFLLSNRLHPHAYITNNDKADYLIDYATRIGTQSWSQLINKNTGTQGAHEVVYTIRYENTDYQLTFFDYNGEDVYYSYQEDRQQTIDLFHKVDGIIIVVSDKHYNYQTENFNTNWLASVEKLFKTIGQRPTVLVLTKGDELMEKKGISPETVGQWFSQGTKVFKASMEKLTGQFDVFVKSAKLLIERQQNGRAALTYKLEKSPADLAEPLLALLQMLDKQAVRKQDATRTELRTQLKEGKENAFTELSEIQFVVRSIITALEANTHKIDAMVNQKVKQADKVAPYRKQADDFRKQVADQLLELSAKPQQISSATSLNTLSTIVEEAQSLLEQAKTTQGKSNEQVKAAEATPDRGWFDKLMYVSVFLFSLVSFFG